MNQIFNWSNAISASKIDKILMNESWENMHPLVKVADLSKSISEHNPILVEWSQPVHKVRPLELELIWLNQDHFRLLVSEF